MTPTAADLIVESTPDARPADAVAALLAAAVGAGLMVVALWACASADSIAGRLADPFADPAALAWPIRLAGVGAGSAAQALFLTAVAAVAGRSRSGDLARLALVGMAVLAFGAGATVYLLS